MSLLELVMPVICIGGKIYSSAFKLTFPNHPEASWGNDELGIEMTLSATIKDSIVTVACDINKFEKEKHVTEVLKIAYDFIRTTLDLLSFVRGIAIHFSFETLE